MRIVLTEWTRDWRGAEPQAIAPRILALEDRTLLLFLLVMLGNGEFDEACFESESADVVDAVRGLLTGTGRARRVDSHPLAASARLRRPGYEIYVQGEASVFFVNPQCRPELFAASGLAVYSADFGANHDTSGPSVV